MTFRLWRCLLVLYSFLSLLYFFVAVHFLLQILSSDEGSQDWVQIQVVGIFLVVHGGLHDVLSGDGHPNFIVR